MLVSDPAPAGAVVLRGGGGSWVVPLVGPNSDTAGDPPTGCVAGGGGRSRPGELRGAKDEGPAAVVAWESAGDKSGSSGGRFAAYDGLANFVGVLSVGLGRYRDEPSSSFAVRSVSSTCAYDDVLVRPTYVEEDAGAAAVELRRVGGAGRAAPRPLPTVAVLLLLAAPPPIAVGPVAAAAPPPRRTTYGESNNASIESRRDDPAGAALMSAAPAG